MTITANKHPKVGNVDNISIKTWKAKLQLQKQEYVSSGLLKKQRFQV